MLIDPYRPGTLEALGLHSDQLLKENAKLIIARLTGFRRDGKYKDMAGHDINYLAVSGILSQLGRKGEPPYAPANILADFAGGGLMCVVGILLALVSRGQMGRGQVVENNMVDGSAYLGTFMRLARKTSLWNQPKGHNFLDGGCPWYDVYECKDGAFMAVGALEEKFYVELMKGLEIRDATVKARSDKSLWPSLRDLMKKRFKERTRPEWEAVFDGKDACCTPVFEQAELESSEYEQRPAVGLSEFPALKLSDQDAWVSTGLKAGEGGERILDEWLGWKQEKGYRLDSNGVFLIDRPKL